MVKNLRVFINHKIMYGYISHWSVKDVIIEFVGKQDDLFKIVINPAQYCSVIGNIAQNGRVDVIDPINVTVDINGISYPGVLNVSIDHGCLIVNQCRNHSYIKLSRTETFFILTEFKVAFRNITGELLDEYLNENTLKREEDGNGKIEKDNEKRITNDVHWSMYEAYSTNK